MRVATGDVDGRFGLLGAGFRRAVTAPFRRQTYLNLAYLLLAFPLGIAYLVFITVGFSLGVFLAVILIGIPILAATVVLSLFLAGFERWLTSAMLPVDVPSRTGFAGESHREQLISFVTHRKTWTSVLYLPMKFVIGVVSFVLALVGLSTGVAMLWVPLYYDRPGLYVGLTADRAPELHPSLYLGWDYLLVGVDAVVTVGHWEVETLPQALVVATAGVVVLVGTVHLLNALARATGWLTRVMLADGYDPLAVVRGRL